MKKTIYIVIMLLATKIVSAQDTGNYWSIRAGAGTSWISIPRSSFSDTDGPWHFTNQIDEARSGSVISVSLGYHINLGKLPLVINPQLGLAHMNGSIRFTRIGETAKSVIGKQEYLRLQLPILAEWQTKDNFSFVFGPVPFINLHNNRILDEMSMELLPETSMNSTYLRGLSWRIGISKAFNRYELGLNWDFDSRFGNFMERDDGVYYVKLYSQSLFASITLLLRD